MIDLFPISCTDNDISANGRNILSKVSISIQKGKGVAILGANGAGKTTLLKSLINFKCINSSPYLYSKNRLDKDILKNVSFIPQNENFFSTSTTKNLKLFCQNEYCRNQAMKRFKLLELESTSTVKLSSGEKQRLSFARASLLNPSLLLLDEATSHMDLRSKNIIHEYLLEYKCENTFILATHDINEAKKLCDTVIFIDHGIIKEEASMKQFLSSKENIELKRELYGI